MNANEKAKELIEKIENIELIQTGYEDFHIDSKEVALLCIDEIINNVEVYGGELLQLQHKKYWQKVKDHLTQMKV